MSDPSARAAQAAPAARGEPSAATVITGTTPPDLPAETVRALRARGQRLDEHGRQGFEVDAHRAHSAHQVVSEMVAIQAPDLAAAMLGVGVRRDGLTSTDVDEARNEDRTVVRTWCLRGTLHLVAAQDVRWLLDLLRPVFVTMNRRRRAEFGLDDADTRRGVETVVQSLATEGPLTRADLATRLEKAGVAWRGQATIHVLWRAAMDGLVCYGPDRDAESTFVMLDDWIQRGESCARAAHLPEVAILELLRRYVRAYGPTTPRDFEVWSGLPRGVVNRAWAALGADARQVTTPFGPMWLHSDREPVASQNRETPSIRLLPAYDGIWLGHKNHDWLLAPELQGRVFPGGGVYSTFFFRPIVLCDGRAVGTWVT